MCAAMVTQRLFLLCTRSDHVFRQLRETVSARVAQADALALTAIACGRRSVQRRNLHGYLTNGASILIAGERRRDSVWGILERVEAVCGKTTAALSAVTAVELTHGIYRARTDADRKRRENFVENSSRRWQCIRSR
jgi:hypothetical protein